MWSGGDLQVSTELKIWAAGIFDGEGSALIESTGENSYAIVVAVGAMDHRITDPIKEAWSGHYRANQDVYIEKGLSNKRDYSLYFSRDEAKKFLVDVFPYLRGKRKEVVIVVSALNSIPGEAAIKKMGLKRAPRGTTACLKSYFQELRKISLERNSRRKSFIE